MKVLLRTLVVALLCYIGSCDELEQSRSLYDLNLPDRKSVNVSTIVRNLDTPVGIACGKFKGNTGLFVSSFGASNINFVSTNWVCERAGNCVKEWVAGKGTSGVTDGALNVATFADPSRMVYLESMNTLIVTDRANGYVRYIDFNNQLVGTMMQSNGARVSLLGSAVSDSNPEIDIKVSGEYIYVSDSQSVYNVTGDDGTLSRAFNFAVQKKYTALKSWQLANDYDILTRKIFISSIAVNDNQRLLYVAYTFSRSAIVVTPLEPNSPSDVYILSSDDVSYNIPQTYPRPRNGNLFSAKVSGFALVTFPIHMHYDRTDNVLYWLEVYSHLSSGTSVGALGAVALRRLKFTTNQIDYYAGDEGTFRNIIGRTTGFKDGFSDKAQFSYPVSLAFYSNTGSQNTGPQLYVCDYGNSALRRVATVVNTGAPTAAPTISRSPTYAPSVSIPPTPMPTIKPTSPPTMTPSQMPTQHSPTSMPSTSQPTVAPTTAPTPQPTVAPTVSHMPTEALEPTSVPTMLNGDCFQIILMDEFGDGWNGLTLTVEHHGLLSPSDPTGRKIARDKDPNAYFSAEALSPDGEHNPLIHRICASLDEDKYYQRGKYILEIRHNMSVPNAWEIQYLVAMKSADYNDWIYGDLNTRMEFDFTSEGTFESTRVDRPLKDATVCHRCKHPAPKPPPGLPPPVEEEPESTDVPKHKVPFVLHDSEGDGWFSSSGLSAKFSISDKSKMERLVTGTICGDVLKEDCEAELRDGDYYFRVGGGGDDHSNQISWTFCGVHGKAMQQLSFAIMEGKCVPGHLSNALDMIGAEEKTTITMRGELILSNIFSERLSIIDDSAFEAAIANILRVDSSEVMVTSTCVTRGKDICSSSDDDDDGSSNSHKRLTTADTLNPGAPVRSMVSYLSTGARAISRSLSETFSLDIVFVVRIVAEDYSVQGSLYHDAKALFNKKKTLMEESFHKRSMQGELRYSASSMGSAALAFAHVEHMVPLKSSDYSYKFQSLTKAPTPAPRVEAAAVVATVVVDESTEQAELVLLPLAIVGVTALALVGVVMWSRRFAIEAGVNGLAEGTDESPMVVGGWRSKVLDRQISSTSVPSTCLTVNSSHPVALSDADTPVAFEDADVNMGTERDLYRITSDMGASRYRHSVDRDSRSSEGIARMVHISGTAPSSRNSTPSSRETILRNQLHQLECDDESSV